MFCIQFEFPGMLVSELFPIEAELIHSLWSLLKYLFRIHVFSFKKFYLSGLSCLSLRTAHKTLSFVCPITCFFYYLSSFHKITLFGCNLFECPQFLVLRHWGNFCIIIFCLSNSGHFSQVICWFLQLWLIKIFFFPLIYYKSKLHECLHIFCSIFQEKA